MKRTVVAQRRAARLALRNWRRWVWIAGGALAALLAIAAGAGYAFLRLDLAGLPSTERLLSVTPPNAARLYAVDGSEFARLFEEHRVAVDMADIPASVVDAVVAVEDKKFWSHWGIDLFGILRALLVDLREGEIVQGGSTITQQLARTLFLNREVTLTRKIKEALVALRIERAFSKEEIMVLYLNQVCFGEGAYGVEVAAETFLGKRARDLTLGESALLAGLIKNPEGYSPRRHLERALARRQVVLASMADTGVITREEAAEAGHEPVRVVPRQRRYRAAPYFVELVRLDLEERYGSDAVYRGGLRVFTTLDTRLQAAAESAVTGGLAAREEEFPHLKRRLGRGRDAQGERTPLTLQAALVAVDPASGGVRAMVGGRDFYRSPFNRATQARRQPGSAFKLFVYSAALDQGLHPGSLFEDKPIEVITAEGTSYRPQNYDPGFRGVLTMRRALQHSVNTIAVQLGMEIGPDKVVERARQMGIRSPLLPYPSVSLGAFEVSLLELTSAYSCLENGGVRAEPHLIVRVEDANGRVLEERRPSLQRAISEENAYVMYDMLSSVVDHGTGHRARELGLEGPAAGKTGTTNEYADAWFVGMVPSLTAGVWVGFDEKISLGSGQAGSRVALPIWTEFMLQGLRWLPGGGAPAQPADVRRVPVCDETGEPAGPGCRAVHLEVLPPSVPEDRMCPRHNAPRRLRAEEPARRSW